MTRVYALAAALLCMLLAPAGALAHAVLVDASPAPDARLDAAPDTVRVEFNEPVQLLDPAEDADVVDERGLLAQAGPAMVDAGDARVIEIPLRAGLGPGTYTARWRVIGADSHVVGGAYVFGVGVEDLSDPFLAGAAGAAGPSETSVWMVGARLLEVVGLAGLLGLIGARLLVWGATWRRAPAMAGGSRDAMLAWGRDAFWSAFGVMALAAMIAEGYVLVVQSAATLGTGVGAVLTDTAGIGEVLADTRFGELLQLRAGLLFVLFAVAAWQFLGEHGAGQIPTAATAAGRTVPMVAMGVLAAATLGVVAEQGHASQTDRPWLQVPAEAVHIGAAGIWLVGLAGIAVAARRLPRIASGDGSTLAARLIGRYSTVALVLVAVVVATGVVRTLGELDAPAQLWDTAYGRSILIKIAVLACIVGLALGSRRIVTALERLRRPGRRAVGLIPPRAALELGLAVVVLVAASLLGGQVPGRL